jgi:hypothetical protein
MNPLNLFSSVKSGLITVAIVALISFVGLLWVQKDWAQRQVESLAREKAALQSAVLAREIENGGLKIAIETLEDTMARIEEHRQIEEEINKEIENASPDEDGPVAPVLRRALDGVARMYNDKTR